MRFDKRLVIFSQGATVSTRPTSISLLTVLFLFPLFRFNKSIILSLSMYTLFTFCNILGKRTPLTWHSDVDGKWNMLSLVVITLFMLDGNYIVVLSMSCLRSLQRLNFVVPISIFFVFMFITVTHWREFLHSFILCLHFYFHPSGWELVHRTWLTRRIIRRQVLGICCNEGFEDNKF